MTQRIVYKTDLDLPQGIERWLYAIVKGCVGSEKAVSREQINNLLSRYHNVELDDRSLRRVVEKIRNRGVRLCDLEDGSGLFIAKTEEEYRSFKLRYGKHAYSLMRTIRAMDKGISVEDLTEDFDELPREPEPVQMGLL